MAMFEVLIFNDGGVMEPFKATKTFIFLNKEGNIDYKMKYLNVDKYMIA